MDGYIRDNRFEVARKNQQGQRFEGQEAEGKGNRDQNAAWRPRARLYRIFGIRRSGEVRTAIDAL